MKHPNNPKPIVAKPLTKAAFRKDAQTVITAETKVTICPPYKPRFEAHTLPFVQTANQSGRVVAEGEAL